ncbi:MAG TPA: protein kinase, partial [Anaeromyxobacteraceae bacterium]|nr:protein kinase [Anaeromyxobacteraceae bacterium]
MSPSSTIASRGEPVDLASLAGQKLGNYRLEQLVGRGRMGVVYRATDEALLRPTAVKVLSWAVAEAAGHDPVQWFLAEARMVARINHPRVVQIYGVARQGELCYIAMEYVAGESVEALVARGGPLAPEVATDFLLQAASALQAAHVSGVVHRDVKPGNLLVDRSNLVKLGDFGMALGPPDARIGNAQVRVGTPYYTAPEVWRGEPASPASDIYSLGASYFQLLTGRPPYPGHDVPAVEHGHLRAPVPDPRTVRPQLPPTCAALATRLLAKTPAGRPASAQEVIWEGRRVLAELQSALAAAPTARPARSLSTPHNGAPAPGLAEGVAGPRPCAELAEAFQFVRRPFFEAEPATPPYQGEPFATARKALLKQLSAEKAPVVALTGPAGSGRTVLSRGLAAALAASRLALVLDLARGTDGDLLQRLCRAAGAVELSAQSSLEALVERLGEEQRQRGTPLLVLDGLTLSLPPGSDLPALLAAARGTRAFQVLLVGPPGMTEVLTPAGSEKMPEIPLVPLPREAIGAYLEAWLRVTRAPTAPSIVITPDAALLAGLRTDGLVSRLDCLAENMLLLAAAGRVRTL